MALIDRFRREGAIVEALLRQRILDKDQEAAVALAAAGTLVSFAPGEELIRQGDSTDEAYFILAGTVRLKIKGELLPYPRGAGEVVGEFAAINNEIRRTATVIADEEVIALKCDSQALINAANQHWRIWQLLAIELTRKLEQRNQLISKVNDRPKIFMVAAKERTEVGEELRLALSSDFDVTYWNDEDLLPAGRTELEELRDKVGEADFGIVLAHPDDLRKRDRHTVAVSETILLELGYILSDLGRHRTILLVPESGCDEIPAPFMGMTPWCYRELDAKTPTKVLLGAIVRRIRNHITERKARSRLSED